MNIKEFNNLSHKKKVFYRNCEKLKQRCYSSMESETDSSVNKSYLLKILEMAKQIVPHEIAKSLVDVQPMDGKPFMDLYNILKENPKSYIVLTNKKDNE